MTQRVMRSDARVRVVIFDFDGVLADTEALHCTAFQQTAAASGIGLSTPDYYNRLLGLPDRECLAAVWGHAQIPLTAAELDVVLADKRARYATLAERVGLYPGIRELLGRLVSHFALAVASGAYRDEIECVLGRAGVRSHFVAVVAAEDVRAGKPAPDPFLQALAAVNAVRDGVAVTPSECLVIEDSPHGITAAKAAGMQCLAVTTNHPAEALAEADRVVADISVLRPEDLAA